MTQITFPNLGTSPARRLRDGLLSLLFPPRCPLCDCRLVSPAICENCSGRVETIGDPACARCGCPGVTAVEACHNCADKAYLFDRLCAAWVFGQDVQDLIHGLKYEGKTWLAPVIVSAIQSRVGMARLVSRETVVVPVPLHCGRLRERGYNQSELLTKGLARALGVPHKDALVRVRMTETQTQLGLEDRTSNVAGAFALRKGTVLEGRRVLLVDDVVTTGSTVNACADVLRRGGASEVVVAAAASPYRI